MSEYDNNLRGALFKNNKRTEERQPEYTGNCEIDGKEYWVSAWVRESKNGTKFFSMAYTPKEQNVVQSAPQVVTSNVTADVDSQIPF